MKYVKNHLQEVTDENWMKGSAYAWGNLFFTNPLEYAIQKLLRQGATDEYIDEFVRGYTDNQKEKQK
jgi:hypothetical protein